MGNFQRKPYDFRALFDSKSGLDIDILGSAPSLTFANHHTSDHGFFMGDSFLRIGLDRYKTRYYVRANSEYPSLEKPSDVGALAGLEATTFLASTVMETTTAVRVLVEREKLAGTFLFDQRHFEWTRCEYPSCCCMVLDEKGSIPTLQELVASYFGLRHHYSTADTVAIHALALSLLLGFETIHLIGVEMPFFKSSYVYASTRPANEVKWRNVTRAWNSIRTLSTLLRGRGIRGAAMVIRPIILKLLERASSRGKEVSLFAEDFPRIFSDFQYLVDLALQQGRTIYYCSTTSNLRHLNGILPCPHLGKP